MDERLRSAVVSVIATADGGRVTIENETSVGGGCINDARIVHLDDGRRFFVKSNAAPLPAMFEREAEGLEALAHAGSLRAPRPIGHGGGEGDTVPFLVIEYIETGRRRSDFSERFGRGLAELHRRATADRFGFASDNYIGATPQPNRWADDWVEFWRDHRLGHQLRLARRNGVSDHTLERAGDALLLRLDELISAPDERPSLLHGDLWAGNYMVDGAGEPVLIDPATYYGRREADLAMTQLFGGFDARFYAAYAEAWPLAPGSDERLDIYRLYHQLNHLNLFGASYRAGCMAILERYT